VPQLDRPLAHGPEIDLLLPALLPDDYIPDVHTRLVLYKRIAGAPDAPALDDLQVELIDRFGLLPEAARNLFHVTALKLQAAPLGIRKIELGAREGRIVFDTQPAIDATELIGLIQREPTAWRLDGPERLRLYGDFETAQQRFDTVTRLLETLQPEP